MKDEDTEAGRDGLSEGRPNCVPVVGALNSYFEAVRQAAEQGHPECQFELGTFYLAGNGTPRDALEWIGKAAQQGLVEAQLQLANMMVEGIGTAPNLPNAVEWLVQASLQRPTSAAIALLEVALAHPPLVADRLFQTSFSQAARCNFPEGMRMAAYCIWHGLRSEKDLHRALSLMKKSAQAGDAMALYHLHYLLRDAEKVHNSDDLDAQQESLEDELATAVGLAQKDYQEGDENEADDPRFYETQHAERMERLRHLLAAAEAGVLPAKFAVGRFLVRWNYETGLDYIFEAADEGWPEAQYWYSQYFLQKKGGFPEAIYWARKAAAAGHHQAKEFLSRLYAGAGAEKQTRSEASWLRLFAEAGVPAALFDLGQHYYLGLRGDENHTEAVRLFTAAAVAGNKEAQARLSLCYELGAGCVKDREMAQLWLDNPDAAVLRLAPTIVTIPCVVERKPAPIHDVMQGEDKEHVDMFIAEQPENKDTLNSEIPVAWEEMKLVDDPAFDERLFLPCEAALPTAEFAPLADDRSTEASQAMASPTLEVPASIPDKATVEEIIPVERPISEARSGIAGFRERLKTFFSRWRF